MLTTILDIFFSIIKEERYSSFFKLVFPGENDIDQLGIVIRALGTPNEEIWPGVKGIELKWIVY